MGGQFGRREMEWGEREGERETEHYRYSHERLGLIRSLGEGISVISSFIQGYFCHYMSIIATSVLMLTSLLCVIVTFFFL